MRSWLYALVSVPVLAAGCGPTCQSSCQKIYSPDECNIPTPGVEDWTDQYKSCVSSCEDALTKTGDLGDYDPDKRNTTGEAITLENEQQAAAWMDCIDQEACDRLSSGYCAPL